MKKKPISLRRLALTKSTITSLDNRDAVKGGVSNNQYCLPPDDGGTRDSNQCASALCPRDSDLCYSGKIYLSQCCV